MIEYYFIWMIFLLFRSENVEKNHPNKKPYLYNDHLNDVVNKNSSSIIMMNLVIYRSLRGGIT